MARFAVLFLAALVCTTYAFPDHDLPQECGQNEVFNSCGTACEPTCQNPQPRSCVFMCKIGCECKEGFMRSHPGGACIPSPQCLLRN